MESLAHFLAPPSACGYLPERTARLEYEFVGEAKAADYHARMVQGWRRFGRAWFRPRCQTCTACQTLRVVVERFRPDRSQRRAWKLNAGAVRLVIGEPSATRAKLDLYDRYHAFQTDAKGWPAHPARDAAEYASGFLDNPFPTQEWCYYLGDRLVGVGYVDDLPGGLSAIYFYYDPAERHRSLGTYNVLHILEQARGRGIPYVYLGYYVAGSPSMIYKARFRPNQVLGDDGRWQDFMP